MSDEKLADSPLWYVIHTRPREELRADQNLKAWSVETFFPLIRKRSFNKSTQRSPYMTKPLFPGYLFARFDATRMLHKVRFTRGVHYVVHCDGQPVSVDQEILNLILERMGEDGYIKMSDDLKPGDKVVVSDGPFRNFVGLFERSLKHSDRIMILLTNINYQGRISIEPEMVRKIS